MIDFRRKRFGEVGRDAVFAEVAFVVRSEAVELGPNHLLLPLSIYVQLIAARWPHYSRDNETDV